MYACVKIMLPMAMVLVSFCAGAPAVADDDTVGALPGVSRDGLYGGNHLPRPASVEKTITVAAGGGYGLTESVGPVDGVHHRVAGSVALGFSPLRQLSLGLGFDGRYDRHPDEGGDKSYGIVGEPRLRVRAGDWLSENFQLGGEVSVWVPGEDAPSLAWDATTVDAKLLGALGDRSEKWSLRAAAGFRFDNSRKVAPDLTRISAGDRVALGLSSSNALLTGLGAAFNVGRAELLAEFTWDILIGEDAPGALESPLIGSLGARYKMGRAWGLGLWFDVCLGKRPGLTASDPLVPVEPRFATWLGVTHVFDLRELTPEDVPPQPEPPAPGVSLAGLITDPQGQPIGGAEVMLVSGETTIKVTAGEDGRFSFEAVPLGPGTLSVVADDRIESTSPVDIAEGMSPELQPVLLAPREAQQVGSALRGTVQSFGGKPLVAKISVEPLGRKLTTDSQGLFDLDVEPGTYTVKISVNGFKTQIRTIAVGKNEVGIINVDLRPVR